MSDHPNQEQPVRNFRVSNEESTLYTTRKDGKRERGKPTKVAKVQQCGRSSSGICASRRRKMLPTTLGRSLRAEVTVNILRIHMTESNTQTHSRICTGKP